MHNVKNVKPSLKRKARRRRAHEPEREECDSDGVPTHSLKTARKRGSRKPLPKLASQAIIEVPQAECLYIPGGIASLARMRSIFALLSNDWKRCISIMISAQRW